MSDLGEHVGLHSDELRTFCAALTGDAEEADGLASRAAGAADSRAVRRGDTGADVAVWRAAVHEYVTSRSDRKQARVRAVRVLRELEDLEPRDIAPLVGRRTRWVSRQLARTPLHRPDGLEAVPPRRTGRAIAFGTAVVLLVALGAAGVLKARDDGPSAKVLGVAPTVSGLLPWPARGELGRDRALHAAAAKLWRSSDSAVKATYVLWAGHASGGRLVLLQAAVGPERLIALVADGDSGLRLVRLGGVPDERAALVIEYGGPQPSDLGVDGTLLRTLRLLVAPGTVSAERRGVLLASSRDPAQLSIARPRAALADWRNIELGDGLTAAWLDPGSSPALTAVRFGQRTAAAVLVPAAPGFALLRFRPMTWSGNPIHEVTGYPAESKTEASLALAQLLRVPELEIRVVDAGRMSEAGVYAVREADSVTGCEGCTQLYAILSGDLHTADGATTSIGAVDAIVSLAGTVVIQAADFSTYWLLGPTDAARCVFGTHTPPAPVTPEPDATVIGAAEYDGSYVCVNARGKVIDRSGRNTGFRAAG